MCLSPPLICELLEDRGLGCTHLCISVSCDGPGTQGGLNRYYMNEETKPQTRLQSWVGHCGKEATQPGGAKSKGRLGKEVDAWVLLLFTVL